MNTLFKTFIHNNKIYDISEFERIYRDNYPSVYEVVRIIDRTPLFLEEHYERLLNSSKLLGFKLDITYDGIKAAINNIIKSNNVSSNNIKLVVTNLSQKQDVYLFFIESKYPEKSMYENGVNTLLYKAERENPNAKVINNKLRNTINSLIKEKGCYEAVLVNSKGELTEGSRSNIFFIKGENIITAPSKDVLEGITRKRIISLCNKNKINIIEKRIKEEDLSNFQASFICGTSPKVLPISTMDDYRFSTKNPILLKIMDIYDREINEYIKKNTY